MNELIPVIENGDGGGGNNEILISGRDLHGFLEVGTPYVKWFDRMTGYGFEENVDFLVTDIFVPNSRGGRQMQIDHHIKLDMAKEISMLQRNERGKQARQYFIEIEKKWNSPEMIVQRAMEIQQKKIESLEQENDQLKPKALFADAVETSKSSVLIGELAKIIKQNGVDIGQNRLFEWLRNNGFLIKQKGENYNSPTQRSMEQELLEIKKNTINNPDGSIRTTRTPKVTGKGQIYFVKKFLSEES